MKNKKKNMQENFDYIKTKFDSENITAPSSLDEFSVMKMTQSTRPKRIRFTQSRAFKTAVSAVACFAVVVTAIAVSNPFAQKQTNSPETENKPAVSAVNSGIVSFSSNDEIKQYIKKCSRESVDIFYLDAVVDTADTVKSAVQESGNASSASDSSNAQLSYGKTYVQHEDVDEADILKNDGKYIYYVNAELNTVDIYKIKGSKTKKTVSIEKFKNDFEKNTITDLYVKDSQLVILTTGYKQKKEYYESYTALHSYDLSDISNPKKIASFRQSGGYISSRMIGDTVYLVTEKYVHSGQCKNEVDYIPSVSRDGEKEQVIKCSDIAYVKGSESPQYIVVSAVEAKTGKSVCDTKAFLGVANDVYCSTENLYVTGQLYDYSDEKNFDNTKTCIIKIDLQNKLKTVASAKVKGYSNNQFSFDEKDGYLRVATFSYDKKGTEENNLFILDKNLKKVGEIAGFEKGETIKSVRFIGDMAYVITYKQIDPLFVIDVSDPTNPQIKGSVKITGFSSQLIPIDENTILGIGYMTQVNNNAESTDGLKLALFDVSDPANPKVSDSKTFKNMYSEAQYTHKAIMVNSLQNYIAIPYETCNTDSGNPPGGVLRFEITEKGINVLNQYKIKTDYSSIYRCTFADSTIYAFDGSANLYTIDVDK